MGPLADSQTVQGDGGLSIAVNAVIGAALWLPYYAYEYGEFPHPVSAKSPNPGQGYLAQRRRER